MLSLKQYIRNISNFPKEGIQFKDITPLLLNSDAVSYCLEQLLEPLKTKAIDKVVAIESRGFFFGTLLAQQLNAGFVPVRKVGKLPYKTLSTSYHLEYGSSTLEIHKDAISKGDSVLLHDDVLATGGTSAAAASLIETLGGHIVQCNFIMELTFLNGHELLKNHNIHSLVSYQD